MILQKPHDNLDVWIGNNAIDTELQLLIDVLPERIRRSLEKYDINDLMEVVLDLGRSSEARFASGEIVELGDGDPSHHYSPHVTLDEIHHVVRLVGDFTSDNRAGIPRTLHRISAMRNRQGEIVGLTCRVGKVITGTIAPIEDLIESGKSLLLLGRPGVGKTTKLREVAKLLADKLKKRVVIVDTSNEIAGDGDIPHPAVGRARRMQVSCPEKQKEVMIEAVENHTPEVIVVDEIGTEDEALAARTIAERGVILIATAHGSTLESLIKNPILSDLVGGIQAVTLGDEEAKRRASQKTILEREKKPTFDIAVEIRDRNTLAVYPDVAEAVDHLLRGWTLFPEVRKIDQETGGYKVLQTDISNLPEEIADGMVSVEPSLLHHRPPSDLLSFQASGNREEVRIFLYSISKALVDRILERLNLKNISITNNLYDATAIIALRGTTRPGSKLYQLAKDYEVPIFVTKTNTMPQIQRALREAIHADAGIFADKISDESLENETEVALKEAQDAIDLVLSEMESVELAPRRSYIRRLQHELVEKSNLNSLSVGDEPNRRLRILPPRHHPDQWSPKK